MKRAFYVALFLSLSLTVALVARALVRESPAREGMGRAPGDRAAPTEPVGTTAPEARGGSGGRRAEGSERAAAATADEEGPTRFGAISVRVLYDHGRSVEHAQVRIRHPALIERSLFTEAGEARFERVPVAEGYELAIDESSLPAGYLLPREQSERYGPGPLRVDVTEQGVTPLVIQLELGATVQGRIVGPLGKGAESCHVRLNCSELESVYMDTDEEGYFQGTIHRGTYLAVASLGASPGAPRDSRNVPSFSHRLKDATPPLPRRVEAEPGSNIELFFRFGSGEGTIRGAIHDEAGQGFAGLRVMIAPHELEGDKPLYLPFSGFDITDEEGTFAFTNLFAGEYRVEVDCSGYSPRARPGQSTIGRLVEPLFVSLETDQELPPLIVPRAHPIRIHGSLGAGNSIAASFILRAEGKDWRRADSEAPVELAIGADGLATFEFWVDRFEEGGLLVIQGVGDTWPEGVVTVPVEWDRRSAGDSLELGVVAR